MLKLSTGFATPEAVAEMGRVLKPGGVLGLIWNMRDTSVPWVAAMQTIIDAHQGDTPRHQTGKWRNVFPAKGFKSLGEQHARNVHIGNPEHVIIDRDMSTSFIAALPAKKRAEVEQSLRTLISETPELAGHNEVGVPYDTLMVAFQRC